MYEVLVNRLGGLSLPKISVVRLTDRPDMTLDIYRGCKTTKQQLYLSPGLVKVNPRLITSDDVCERSIVVFRELFQLLFCDSYPSKFLFFCKEMGYPSGTYHSHF